MKKIVIPAVAVLVLAGIAGALFAFDVLPKSMIGLGDEDPAAVEEVKAEPPPMPPAQIKMDTFTVPVITGGEHKTTLHITLVLEAESEDVTEIKAQLPKIQDVLYRSLYGFLGTHMERRRDPDLFAVKARLMRSSRRSGRRQDRERADYRRLSALTPARAAAAPRRGRACPRPIDNDSCR